MRRFLLVVAASLGLVAAPVAAEPAEAEEAENCESCAAVLDLALAHPRRDADRARDKWRHPAETLAFFRVRPGMTVVDYIPAGGWYTRVLVPYLGADGRYIALNPDVSAGSEGQRKYFAGLAEGFPAKAAEWDLADGARIEAYDGEAIPEELAGTVDRVLIFREMHNLKRNGWTASELAKLHALLKPGGMLGIVQHRARPNAPGAYADGGKGYLREADVVKMVEAEGFALVARSEVNANPADPADHAGGVWSLPPSLRADEADKPLLAAIGESDRMTLLFRKARN